MTKKKGGKEETLEVVVWENNLVADQTTERSVLYLGIDLGTSRSAVSSSNGMRISVESVVGRPKDPVSFKFLNRDILFGQDALQHRLSLDIIRPLKKGNLHYSDDNLSLEEAEAYRDAARALLGHLVSLADPRPGEDVYAVIGAPTRASTRNKQALMEIARAAGIEAVMIVSEPLAVAYGLDYLMKDAVIVDIGAGTIDLCCLDGSPPDTEDQITIESGGDHVDETLCRLIHEAHPEAQFTTQMIRRIKERFSSLLDSGDPAVVEFPVDGRPTLFDITAELHDAVQRIIPDTVDTLRRLVLRYDAKTQHALLQNVVLSGGGSQIYGLRKALENRLREIGGGHVICVEEPLYAGADGAMKFALDMPETYWDRVR